MNLRYAIFGSTRTELLGAAGHLAYRLYDEFNRGVSEATLRVDSYPLIQIVTNKPFWRSTLGYMNGRLAREIDSCLSRSLHRYHALTRIDPIYDGALIVGIHVVSHQIDDDDYMPYLVA